MNQTPEKFSTPSDCLKVISDLEQANLARSTDRAMINQQFNGGRPFNPSEEKEHQIQVNANFLEGYKIAQNGIGQMNGALLYKDRLANFRCTKGKIEKREGWSEDLTNNVHKSLKRGRSGKKFLYLMQNRNAALALHGIGPLWWGNDFDVMPKFVALDDLLIPTDTPLDLDEEMGHFAINQWVTPWMLYKMAVGEKKQPGWDNALAMAILKGLLEAKNFTPDYFNSYGAPEKMESLWKQRSTWLNSDAAPKVKLTTFYHQSPDSGKWFRKVLVREGQQVNIDAISTDKFLYSSDAPFAGTIDEILHMQYGDGSVVAPFKFKSVRGLGILLFSVVELLNRMRCQLTQHIFSLLVPLLRVQNPLDRDRPRMLTFQPYAVLEDGVSFVPNTERHQVDANLVESGMNEFRQLMTESSSSFVQDIDNGTGKQQTLGEAQIKLQSANRIVSVMLQGAYVQEVFLYEEYLRRLMKGTSTDPIAKKFMEDCKADGIPDELMKPDLWLIDVTKAFGAGDQTLAQQEATALLGLSPQLDPASQRKVRRDYISVMTRNPEKALDLVPEQQDSNTDGRKAAISEFGALMQGAQVPISEGIEQRDYVAQMLASMEAVIARIQGTDNVGLPSDVAGLNNCAQTVEQHIQIMAQDPNEKAFVTAAGKELGKMMNDVKAFQQRQLEAAEKGKMDPEQMAKIKTDQIAAAQAMEIKQQQFEQTTQQKQQQFDQKMQHDEMKFALSMKTAQEESRLAIETQMQELEAMKAATVAELEALMIKTKAEILAMKTKTEADIANQEKMAAAQAEAAAKAQKADSGKSE